MNKSDHSSCVQNAHAVIQKLGYDFRQFEMTAFLRGIANEIGNSIELIPWRMSPGLFGTWLKDSDTRTDYIIYDEQVPRLQRRQIIFHELGHKLCGHETLELTSPELNAFLTARLLKADELAVFQMAQLRKHSSGTEDIEAEAFANAVQMKIQKAGRSASKRVISKPLDEYLASLGFKES